jgi:hypothetical protein
MSTNPVIAGTNTTISDGFPYWDTAGDPNARPYSLSDQSLTELQRKTIERKTRRRAVLGDVIQNLSGPVITSANQPKTITGEIMWTFSNEGGADNVYQPIVEPASGSPINTFSTRPEGLERDLGMRRLHMTYAEYAYGLARYEKGVKHNQLDVFDYYSQQSEFAGRYIEELRGKYKREALLETYCTILTETPRSLTQNWNPNNYVIGNTGAQPTYDSTTSDFTTSIVTALQLGATGTNGSNAWANLDSIIALEEYITVDLRIEPLPNGKWLLVLPSKQYRLLAQTNSGQVGSGYQQNDVNEFTYPGVVGEIGNFMIVKDDRYPTVVFDDYTTPSATVEYVNPGNDDSRNRSIYNATGNANLAWDIGFVCGEGALWQLMQQDVYFGENKQGYAREKGTMAFVEEGFGLTVWDNDAASQTDASRFNDSSCAVWFAATSLQA